MVTDSTDLDDLADDKDSHQARLDEDIPCHAEEYPGNFRKQHIVLIFIPCFTWQTVIPGINGGSVNRPRVDDYLWCYSNCKRLYSCFVIELKV